MALIYGLPFALEAPLQPAIPASERALYNHPRLRAWWDVRHDQALVSGGTIVDRKGGVVASLLDAAKRPGETQIIGQRFLVAGGPAPGDDATAPIALTPDAIDVVPPAWTIWSITGGAGASTLSAPWSIPGRDGDAVSLRHRTSDRITIGFGADAAAPVVQANGVASASPHLAEVAYRPSDKRFNLRVDNVNAGSATAPAWVQRSNRLALMGIYDLVLGGLAYGRGMTWAQVIVGEGYAPDDTSLRAAVHAMVADLYPAISLA